MAATRRGVGQLPKALSGVRVVDFTWVRAGPWATRWLGALGAQVIKVEWTEIERGSRLPGATPPNRFQPFGGILGSGFFNDTNANKLGITLNVRSTNGLTLVKRLISISDIVIESFSSGTLHNWGLGYQEMCELKQDIIYVSMSGFGHTGRYNQYTTYGPSAQALSGLTFLSGMPGQPPAGWGWSYMDDTGGIYGALNALYYRNLTGQGQHVDMSQMVTGVTLNGPAILDHTVNGRASRREGYPPGNRAHWPGTPLVNNYRGPTTAPHNVYHTKPGGYNDWCAIACFSDQEWQRLVEAMGAPRWATGPKFATVAGRLRYQDELDKGIEAWTRTLRKYELMERCQAAGVPAMPVQSNGDLLEHDPQLLHRQMYTELDHPVLGVRMLASAPFKLSETPAVNHLPGPLIGQHNLEVYEGLLGLSRDEVMEGYRDGTFWPRNISMEPFPYLTEALQKKTPTYEAVPASLVGGAEDAGTTTADPSSWPLSGLQVLELADGKGQFCGKLMADLGAQVIKIEPPGGQATRTVGPFLQDTPHRDRSLSFWHYNTSKRGITLSLDTEDGRDLFRHLASRADVILETFPPGYLPSLGLGYQDLRQMNPRLIMCSLTPFGQSGPWKDFLTSDLLHLAAGGQMAACGYDEEDVPGSIPIAPGGGNAWHIASNYAFMAILAALVYRTSTGRGQYIDASVHDACAITTEGCPDFYIYMGQVALRQTGRHSYPTGGPQTQFRCKDGRYVNGQIAVRLPGPVRVLAQWMDAYGLADDLLDPRYQDPAVVQENAQHINDVAANFISHLTQEDAYHGAQERGFAWGAVRAPDELLDDPHLQDRGFWATVEHPELGRSFIYPGGPAVYGKSPWQIYGRAPLVGEHNQEVYCGELGLKPEELAILAEAGVI